MAVEFDVEMQTIEEQAGNQPDEGTQALEEQQATEKQQATEERQNRGSEEPLVEQVKYSMLYYQLYCYF